MPRSVQGMGDPMREQRLHPAPGREDRDRADGPCGRIAVAGGGDVGANLLDDPCRPCSQPGHGDQPPNQGSDM